MAKYKPVVNKDGRHTELAGSDELDVGSFGASMFETQTPEGYTVRVERSNDDRRIQIVRILGETNTTGVTFDASWSSHPFAYSANIISGISGNGALIRHRSITKTSGQFTANGKGEFQIKLEGLY